ncbi:MAG: helix-turn-helix transcriptional regulator [Frankiaceae bacterium]
MSGASDHLPRLLALVPYLLAHPGERLADVARTFGVGERQLRADLDLLWMCGLPGHGPGDLIDVSYAGDRVTLSNADTIARPLRLTTDEALALVVALRALADVPGLQERDALDRALAKLEAAAGDAGAVSGRVSVVLETQERALAVARQALDAGRRLHLVYHVPARDETTERDVDPMRLLLVEGRAYLEGWCRLAEGVRLFRLDRVVDIAVLDAPAEPPLDAAPRDLSGGLFRPSRDDLLVSLELAPRARWVADYYPCERIDELPDGGCLASLRTPDPAWVRRLALRLGPSMRVIAPAELAEEIRAEATRALATYEAAG